MAPSGPRSPDGRPSPTFDHHASATRRHLEDLAPTPDPSAEHEAWSIHVIASDAEKWRMTL
ncbi:MAG: hypothetical protein QOF58_3488 [Pseudonocardiales bacterium]|nr:hypothetical protein [Pseudonocardiales bacterium]